MLTNILIGLLCYSMCLLVFLVGWKRHCDRMHRMDEAMSRAFHNERVRRISEKVAAEQQRRTL